MTEAPGALPSRPNSQQLVLRNALYLVGAQALSLPLTIAVNAVMARFLGAEEFGVFYLATTFAAFGFLFVDWGQEGTLPAKVSLARDKAGELLGSALAWRAVAAPVVYVLLALGCLALGYPWALQVALALVALDLTIAGFASAGQDTVRGFERTDIAALSQLGQHVLIAALVVPVLFLGGRLPAVLICFGVANMCVLLFVARSLKPVGVGRLRARTGTVRTLVEDGWPFLLFGLTMALQPNIDAIFLSKLAPGEVVGWHAAARKLVGALVFPAGALIGALYPTLCRLFEEDIEDYRRTTSRALSTSALVVVPLAVGTALYADVAVRIFSEEAFGPAADNLRVMAPFVLLVYFSMPLGSALLAAGRQRAWAGVQLLCVLISLVLDPLLVPWFQERMGNGGIGIAVATLTSEVFMVSAGIWLTPKGVFDRTFGRTLWVSVVGGAAMVAVALLLSSVSPFVTAPLSVGAYGLCLWALGELKREHMVALRGWINRKMGRG